MAHAQVPLVPLANPIANEARAALAQHEAAVAAIYGRSPKVVETRRWKRADDGKIKPAWAEAAATRGLQHLKLHPHKGNGAGQGGSKTMSVSLNDVGPSQTPDQTTPAQIANDYEAISVQEDSLGMVHSHYQQVCSGVEVFGGEMIAEGTETEVTDTYGSSFDEANISTTPVLTDTDAIDYAEASRAYTGSFDTPPTAQLVILPSPIRNDGAAGPALLCYKVNLRIDDDDVLEDVDYFVNALDGTIEWTVSKIPGSTSVVMAVNTQFYGRQYINVSHDSNGPGGNRLVDLLRGNMEGANLNSTDNSWSIISTAGNVYTIGNNNANDSDTIVATGFWAAESAYDYFKNVYGRIGWNNQNRAVGVRSRWYESRYKGMNSIWDGSAIRLGNGNSSQNVGNFSHVDIVGHEFTHGVVQASAGLIFANESGALNESFADIFGTGIEFYAAVGNYSMHPNFVIGENICANGPIRDMYDPPSRGQKDYYPDLQHGPSDIDHDYGYVHTNSGIQNKVFYLVCAGGINRGYSVSSIGRANAELIFYRALNYKLGSSSGFRDSKVATLKAAAELYGSTQSYNYQQLSKAWASVGVP